MKNKLLFIPLMLIAGTGAFAQSARTVTPVTVDHLTRPGTADRTLTCTADTLRYALVKEYAFNATPAFNALPINPNEEQSQGFVSPGTVSIIGIDFRARVNSANAAATVPVKVYLYSVDAAFKPLAKIDSASLNVVTTTVKYYKANFAAPRTVTGNYAVVVKAAGSTKFDVIANDRDTGTGGELLSYNRWNPGTGLTWFMNSDATSGWAQDFDADISPIVTYTIATDYTTSAASPICLGTPLTFTNTTTPMNTLGSRMYNYNTFLFYFGGSTSDSTFAWDMDDASPVQWSTNAAYTYPAAGSYDATLYTLGGFWNSCADTKTTTIVVNATPVLAVTSPAAVCSPSTVDLTAAGVTAGSTGGGTLTYWTNAGATSSLSTPAAVNASGTYYIQAANGSCTDIEAVTVTINTTPVLSITAPAAVCAPGTVDLTASAVTAGSIGGGTLSYWTDAGATSSLGSPAAVTASGTYYIQSASGSCTDIEPVTVTINPADDATITDPGMLCDYSATVNLTAATSGGSWSGTGILDSFTGAFDPATAGAGSHVVTYTTAGACPGTDNVTIVVSVCTGIAENTVASMNVYPNPSTGIVTVDMGAATTAVMEVYNVIGSKVIALQSATQVTSLDLTALNTGVYFLKVTTANGTATKKITLTK